jgi:hypothetical protein
MDTAAERHAYFHGESRLRTVEEIEAAWQEMFDRQWHERSRMLAADDPRDGNDPGSEGRLELETKYGVMNLGPYSEDEWAEIRGKRAALQWVLGADWDEPQDT